MKTPRPNRAKGHRGGVRYATLAVLTVIAFAVGGYFIFRSGPTPPSIQPAELKQPHSVPRTEPQASVPAKPAPQHPSSSAHLYPSPRRIVPVEKHGEIRSVAGTAKLAIIIDDMGTTLQEARSLAAIGVPLTFSIIPGLRSYREVSSFAASNGIEIMIHIPMQSQGWPERRLEPNGLLVSMSDADIRARLDDFTKSLPNALGVNNHMGSEFTEHEDKMRVVIDVLKGRGLFFIDSVTSPKTVGVRLAQEIGVKSSRRNVFLDNEQNDAYIRGQIRQAVKLASKTGRAIAICHPHPATIQTLAVVLPDLQKQGITLVPASQLVR